MKFGICFLLLVSLPASAEIGDSYTEYARQVGKAEKVRTKGDVLAATHKEKGVTVFVVASKGKIVCEQHRPTTAEEAAAIVKKQKRFVLKLNKDTEEKLIWRSEDGGVVASWDSESRTTEVAEKAPLTPELHATVVDLLSEIK